MNKIDALLMKYNIIPGYTGYTYIKEILKSNILNNNNDMRNIYAMIAKNHKTTSACAERNIRTVIQKSSLPYATNKYALNYLQIEYEEGNYEI